MLEVSGEKHQVELAVSFRYVQEHGWTVGAITGFLSAYYMEDPRFRLSRHYDELDTGTHVWLCELESGMSIKVLLKRLRVDIPPAQVHERSASTDGRVRYVIDVTEAGTDQG